jgi:hypothetical protein
MTGLKPESSGRVLKTLGERARPRARFGAPPRRTVHANPNTSFFHQKLDLKTRLTFRADNFPGTMMFPLKTSSHFSFSAGEKAGMREGKNTNIF